jgi:hypothetical protein
VVVVGEVVVGEVVVGEVVVGEGGAVVDAVTVTVGTSIVAVAVAVAVAVIVDGACGASGSAPPKGIAAKAIRTAAVTALKPVSVECFIFTDPFKPP